MYARLCNKQVFLLGVSFIINTGFAVQSINHHVDQTVHSVHRFVAPFSKNMSCYVQCNQKAGTQGALALQSYFKAHPNHPSAEVVKLLYSQTKAGKGSDVLNQAFTCLTACGAPVTVRFLATFLSEMKDEEVVRAVGVILGKSSYKAGSILGDLAGEQGSESKLHGLLFKKPLQRGCLRVLRHHKEKRIQFKKNLDILRQVFFEMYGPVPKAKEYAKAHGLR